MYKKLPTFLFTLVVCLLSCHERLIETNSPTDSPEPAPIVPAQPSPPPANPSSEVTPTSISLAREENVVPEENEWLEYAGKSYRIETVASLLAKNISVPARVVLEAKLIRKDRCGRCPPMARCQPCGDRMVFEEIQDNPDSQIYIYGGKLMRGKKYRLYLLLESGYQWHFGKNVRIDVRDNAIDLEGYERIKPK